MKRDGPGWVSYSHGQVWTWRFECARVHRPQTVYLYMDRRLLRRRFRYQRHRGRDIVRYGGTWFAGLALAFGGDVSHFGREVVLFVKDLAHYLDEGMRRVRLAI